jgi:GDP/UDP-N,N'-diacetylbacillosamine 2-epimerase (hydrolysing)
MTRKICVVTGSRADYGLLRLVMQGIKDDPELCLQVVVTGMHLSRAFGLTFKEIEADGFKIDLKVKTIGRSDMDLDIAKSMGKGISGCAEAFDKLKPDLIVVLGDRYEIFAAAAAAVVLRIPLAHLHGGETSTGAYDEAFRHSISKMSHLHFVATEEYRNRVIQLGENPDSVFLVGGLGVDALKKITLLTKKELEDSLQIEFLPKSLLITFHPVTLEDETSEMQTRALLLALSKLKNTTLIFTMPNADNGSHIVIKLIQEFVKENDDAFAFVSLGQQRYLSCVAHVDGVIGNSSSGLTEVPSFKKGTINIGSRQDGRLQASSVINCLPEEGEISGALESLFSNDFQSALKGVSNPYGEGGASIKIVNALKNSNLEGIIQKAFYDL